MYKYEYRLINYTYHYAAQERINIGIAFWCPDAPLFWYKVNPLYGRLSKIYPKFDATGYRRLVSGLNSALKEIETRVLGLGEGDKGKPINNVTLDALIQGSILGQSNVIGTGPLMGGLAEDPGTRAAELYDEFIESYESATNVGRVDDEVLWNRVVEKRADSTLGLAAAKYVKIKPGTGTVKGRHYEYQFRMSWHNGKQQVAEPISLDYAHNKSIIERANTWVGRLVDLSQGSEFEMTAIIYTPDGRHDKKGDTYRKARDMLAHAPKVRRVIDSGELDDLWQMIISDAEQHS